MTPTLRAPSDRLPVQRRVSTGRLPDFLIVVAAKSGTSSLFSYLCAHPALFGSTPKEPCFFDPEVNLDRGLGWYRGLFADAEPWQLCGEASTNYTRFPQVQGVPERIKATLPDAKLIYLMRHPVERAYSHYVHAFTKEEYPREPFDLSFEAFSAAYPRCLDGSDYALQLGRYFEHFPREQVLLLFYEDLERDPGALCREVFEFLGVDPSFDPFGAAPPARENVSVTFREGRVRRRRRGRRTSGWSRGCACWASGSAPGGETPSTACCAIAPTDAGSARPSSRSP